MEGLLKPGYHYVMIRDDYSDLEEKIDYYSSNHEEAKFIINNAQNYVRNFINKDLETLISIKVLQKYELLYEGG